MKLRLIGDIHGDMHAYMRLIDGAERSVQVGDYGMGFVDNVITSRYSPHRFIRGNHDSPDVCWHEPNWIPDGTIEDNIMYVGGASSIDRAFRVPGISWWHDEQLSSEQLDMLIEVYATVQPEIMITHECPDFVATEMCNYRGWRKFEDFSRTREAFDRMIGLHKPKLWVYGHWHMDFEMFLCGTKFVCLNINQCMDLDTSDFSYIIS